MLTQHLLQDDTQKTHHMLVYESLVTFHIFESLHVTSFLDRFAKNC